MENKPPRERIIAVRLSDAEYERLRLAADVADRPVSTFIRFHALAAAQAEAQP